MMMSMREVDFVTLFFVTLVLHLDKCAQDFNSALTAIA